MNFVMPNNQSSCAYECFRHGEKTAALRALNSNSKKLGYFVELELELEKI